MKYLEAIEVLIKLGIYPSRSEVLRVALRAFLDKEFIMFQNLERDKFKQLKNREVIENGKRKQK